MKEAKKFLAFGAGLPWTTFVKKKLPSMYEISPDCAQTLYSMELGTELCIVELVKRKLIFSPKILQKNENEGYFFKAIPVMVWR
jgi:hypothetical protein